MDFGVLGFDSLVGSNITSCSSDPETKHNKLYGSGFCNNIIKQDKSFSTTNTNTNINQEEEDDDYEGGFWRSSKMAKSSTHEQQQDDDNNKYRSMLLRSSASPLFSDSHQRQQMLSFSCPTKSEPHDFTLPYFQLTPSSSPYTKTSGNMNSGFGYGGGYSSRGAFTSLQWMELEHQALIYKYITCNMPIPSNLLLPIRRAFESAGYSTFASSSSPLLTPNTLGWGSFHLGFSNSTDPEPGRCRRTDGKKWRCSRDAVVEQKYCERHMNRGRHRSRKPVEGHPAAAAANAKLMLNTTAAASSVVTGGSNGGNGGAAGNRFGVAPQQQVNTLQPDATLNISSATQPSINRMLLKNENVGETRQETQPAISIDLKRKENNHFLVPNKHHIRYEEASPKKFGFVSSDPFLNTKTESHNLLRQFMENWPKNQSNPSQLSDFMSSTSSPTNENVTLSPLRLSREFDPIEMGLGVGNVMNQRQANWNPISWESSIGGPLGEVLHSTTTTTNSSAESKSSSVLNLMSDTSQLSPNGVLQKTVFGSLSNTNSSAGSSPRAVEGACLLNATLSPSSSSLPGL